jgi:uncharacterized protein
MDDQAELKVRVQPRAAANSVVGWREGALAIRLTAPPVDGAANRACRDFLAQVLGVRRADLEILSREKAREKRLRISGLPPAELLARIEAALAAAGDGESG